MRLSYESSGTINGLETLIKDMTASGGINGLMVLSCDANDYTPGDVDGIIGKVKVPLFGGIFPAIIFGRQLIRKGNAVIGLNRVIETQVVRDLSSNASDFEATLEEMFPNIARGQTMMVFVDGFARRINAFIESLFSIFGLEINYIGGGAGSMSMQQKPCLYCNEGLVYDCAVLGLLESASGVGVSHGWHTLNGPYRVTESEHNVIKTLNWRPAFEVYREVVAPHVGRSFGPEDFFDVSKAYPFGITRMSNEQIVRDLVKIGPGDSLVCVGEVPEGDFVSILNGNEASLVAAAKNALQQGQQAFGDGKTEGIRILMDCISRVLFLDDRFERELDAVYSDGVPLAGACSIGEIANSGREFLEFYNKTTVVAVMED